VCAWNLAANDGGLIIHVQWIAKGLQWVDQTLSPGSTSYTITGLVYGLTYTVKVWGTAAAQSTGTPAPGLVPNDGLVPGAPLVPSNG
jgi:hypothetical protein